MMIIGHNQMGHLLRWTNIFKENGKSGQQLMSRQIAAIQCLTITVYTARPAVGNIVKQLAGLIFILVIGFQKMNASTFVLEQEQYIMVIVEVTLNQFSSCIWNRHFQFLNSYIIFEISNLENPRLTNFMLFQISVAIFKPPSFLFFLEHQI